MKKAFLIRNYAQMSDLRLDPKCAKIISKLTNNPNFPDSAALVADLVVIKGRYSVSLANAASGDKAAIAIKNQEKANVVAHLDKLALNVEYQAQYDRAILAGSGFDVSAETSAVTPLTSPEGFKLTDGLNTGELNTSVKTVRQAVSYSHEYSLTPPDDHTNWITKTTTTVDYTFTGLPGGIRVFCRVAAVGRKGQFAYTEVLSRIVQ